MSFLHHSALLCPLDGEPLTLAGGGLSCPHNHRYDLARQGYVNLLQARDKRSRDPGDSKAMVEARRRFLQSGTYQPLATELARLVTAFSSSALTVVDAGCGEGYYAAELLEHRVGLGDALIGFDISKAAMQAAARRLPATWLVASNRQIPLLAESVDVVLSVFGFPEPESFRRVLRPGGLLLNVTAGPAHLLELRQLIYPQIKAKPAAGQDLWSAAGLHWQETTTVNFRTAALEKNLLTDLLAMTPHLYRASAEGKARAAALQSLALTVDVQFSAYLAGAS